MLKVQLIIAEEQFLELEHDWRALSAACSRASIFNSWDWQQNWWEIYGAEHQLCVVAVYRDEQLCAILPLYVRRARTLKMKGVRELRLIGTGGDTSPDYLGLLSLSDCESECIELITQKIADLRCWDVARLTDLCDQPAFNQTLSDKLGAQAELRAVKPIRFIQLPSEFDGYLASLSSNQRKQIRRRRRRFEELGGTHFYRWPSDRPIDDAFAGLVKLHNKRWNQKEDSGSFNTPAYLKFHSQLMHALHQRDELRLYCLEKDEVMIAIEYSYKWKNTVYSFQCGFDPDYAEFRPGQLLLNYSIEDAIKEGIDQYDMLKGDYDYKESAAKETRECFELTAYRNTGAGKLASFSKDLSSLKELISAD